MTNTISMPAAQSVATETQLKKDIQAVAESEGLVLTAEEITLMSEMFGHYLRAQRQETARQEKYRASYKDRLRVIRALQQSCEAFVQRIEQAMSHPYVGPELLVKLGLTNPADNPDDQLTELSNQIVRLKQAIEALSGKHPTSFDLPEFTRGTPVKFFGDDYLKQQLSYLLAQILRRPEHTTAPPSFLERTDAMEAFLAIVGIHNTSKTIRNVVPQNGTPLEVVMLPFSSDGVYDNEDD